ncbi:hypothetical protein A9Q99_21815 [Gammaproteobacteria bacterium 45_16_T64]|nr:hypothetical protein A9Q99_21815 [Gammaproteobacteria bacterium 45_16_T64]
MSLEHAKAVIQDAKNNQLKEIHLAFQDLEELPDSLWELSETTHLFLTGNQLTNIPNDIQKLTQLQHLDLAGNQLTQMSPGICRLEKLNYLDMSSNNITHMPDTVASLRNLISLDCFGNKLSQLPEELGECLNLTSLRAGKNELQSLPKSIGKLTHLDTLDCAYNELEQLPSSIFALTHLEQLDLCGNKIDLPFADFENHQYEPNVLLSRIRQLQHDQSHAQLDKYRKNKAEQSANVYINALDKELKKFPIQGNALNLKIQLPALTPSIRETTLTLNALHDDLTLCWAITQSIQGVTSSSPCANPLMDLCHHSKSLQPQDIERESDQVILNIETYLSTLPPKKNTLPRDTPSSKITRILTGKHLHICCQVSSSPRALFYLAYLWALSSFYVNGQLRLGPQGKRTLLNILTQSLEGHGLTVKNDPRIPYTLLCLSERIRPYSPQVYP